MEGRACAANAGFRPKARKLCAADAWPRFHLRLFGDEGVGDGRRSIAQRHPYLVPRTAFAAFEIAIEDHRQNREYRDHREKLERERSGDRRGLLRRHHPAARSNIRRPCSFRSRQMSRRNRGTCCGCA